MFWWYDSDSETLHLANSWSSDKAHYLIWQPGVQGSCIWYNHRVINVECDETIILPRHSQGLFYDCRHLTKVDGSKFNTSAARDLTNLFCNCASLTELDLSSWDLTNARFLGSMFKGAGNLEKITASNWYDTYKSTIRVSDNMFKGCISLPEYKDCNTNNLFYAQSKSTGYFE